MKLKLIAALALALAVSGCSGTYILRPGDLQPLIAPVPPDQRVAVWQHAIGVLLDEGYVPQVLNEAACYISAKQRDDVTTGPLAGTMAIVTVAPEGNVRVEVSGVGTYHSQDELVADIAKIQQRLLHEIMSPSAPPPPPPPAGTPASPTF